MSLYEFLKILADISHVCANDYLTIMQHIIEYLYSNDKIDKDKNDELIAFLKKSHDYPICINNLEISGNTLMNEPFAYKGNQIAQIKILLQDKIFIGELVNEKETLINYLKMKK